MDWFLIIFVILLFPGWPVPIIPMLFWVYLTDYIRPKLNEFGLKYLPIKLQIQFGVHDWEYYTKNVNFKHLRDIKIRARKCKITGEEQHLQLMTGKWI